MPKPKSESSSKFRSVSEKKKGKEVAASEGSIADTMLIAPEDYYNYLDRNKQAKKAKSSGKVNRVQSDMPTILIAPGDYENLLDRTKIKGKPNKKVTKVAEDDDIPTVLIAPEDYQNLLNRKDQEKRKAATPAREKDTTTTKRASEIPPKPKKGHSMAHTKTPAKQKSRPKSAQTRDEPDKGDPDSDGHSEDREDKPISPPKKRKGKKKRDKKDDDEGCCCCWC